MLNSSVIRGLIKDHNLISEYIDLESQIQPSGFDLSLKEISEYKNAGSVDFSNKERTIAESSVIEADEKGWYDLQNILFKVERTLRGKIEGKKTGIHWWEDTAQPMYFGGQVDHTDLNVRVCMLDDRHRLIGI